MGEKVRLEAKFLLNLIKKLFINSHISLATHFLNKDNHFQTQSFCELNKKENLKAPRCFEDIFSKDQFN